MAGKFGKFNKNSDDKKPTRFYSSKQEKDVAKAVGGKQTANSGAAMFQKGDVTNDLFLIECKTKTSCSETFTLHRNWFVKNQDEAIFMHKKYNALVFNFGPDSPYNKNHYIIDEYLFQTLLEYLEEKENET